MDMGGGLSRRSGGILKRIAAIRMPLLIMEHAALKLKSIWLRAKSKSSIWLRFMMSEES
jgi:hypothetical protein